MRPVELPQLPGLNELRVVLGVCGGIAAYKSAELVREHLGGTGADDASDTDEDHGDE